MATFEQTDTQVGFVQGPTAAGPADPAIQDNTWGTINALTKIGFAVKDKIDVESAKTELGETEASYQQEVSELNSITSTNQALKGMNVSEDDKEWLNNTVKEMDTLQKARERKLITSGGLKARLGAKTKTLIDERPWLATELRGLYTNASMGMKAGAGGLSGGAGGGLPPELVARIEGEQKLVTAGTADGFDMQDPRQNENYRRRLREASIATTDLANYNLHKAETGEATGQLSNSITTTLMHGLSAEHTRMMQSYENNPNEIDAGSIKNRMRMQVATVKSSINKQIRDMQVESGFTATPGQVASIFKNIDEVAETYLSSVDDLAGNKLTNVKALNDLVLNRSLTDVQGIIAIQKVFGEQNVMQALKLKDSFRGDPKVYDAWIATQTPERQAYAKMVANMNSGEVVMNILTQSQAGNSEFIKAMPPSQVNPTLEQGVENSVSKETPTPEDKHNAVSWFSSLMDQDSVEDKVTVLDHVLSRPRIDSAMGTQEWEDLSNKTKNLYNSMFVSQMAVITQGVGTVDVPPVVSTGFIPEVTELGTTKLGEALPYTVTQDRNTGKLVVQPLVETKKADGFLGTDVTGVISPDTPNVPSDVLRAVNNVNNLIQLVRKYPRMEKVLGVSANELASFTQPQVRAEQEETFTGTTQETPSDAFLEHLTLREGVRAESYLDSEEKLTGGTGHLLSKAEQKTYPEGTAIPQEVADAWLEKDTKKAWGAASSQATEIGRPDLTEALASVNFQLGTKWNKEHKKTWSLLKEGKWDEAANEAARSTWFEQTPVRVRDFQEALRGNGE